MLLTAYFIKWNSHLLTRWNLKKINSLLLVLYMYACWATLQGWLLKHSFSQLLSSLMYIKTAILFQSLTQQRSDSSKLKWRGSFLIFSFPFNNAHQFPLPFSIPNLLSVHNPQQPISLINISGCSTCLLTTIAGLYYVALKEMADVNQPSYPAMRLRVKMWDISALAQMIFNTA